MSSSQHYNQPNNRYTNNQELCHSCNSVLNPHGYPHLEVPTKLPLPAVIGSVLLRPCEILMHRRVLQCAQEATEIEHEERAACLLHTYHGLLTPLEMSKLSFCTHAPSAAHGDMKGKDVCPCLSLPAIILDMKDVSLGHLFCLSPTTLTFQTPTKYMLTDKHSA